MREDAGKIYSLRFCFLFLRSTTTTAVQLVAIATEKPKTSYAGVFFTITLSRIKRTFILSLSTGYSLNATLFKVFSDQVAAAVVVVVLPLYSNTHWYLCTN